MRNKLLALAVAGLTPLASGQTNLLINGGFENPGGQAATPAGWTTFANAVTEDLNLLGGDGEPIFRMAPAEGDSALRVFGAFNGAGGGSGAFQDYPAVPGATYEFRVEAATNSFDPINTGAIALIEMRFLDAGGNIIFDSFTGLPLGAQQLYDGREDTWNEFHLTSVAPDGVVWGFDGIAAETVRVQVTVVQPESGTEEGVFYFDNARLFENENVIANPGFDGTTSFFAGAFGPAPLWDLTFANAGTEDITQDDGMGNLLNPVAPSEGFGVLKAFGTFPGASGAFQDFPASPGQRWDFRSTVYELVAFDDPNFGDGLERGTIGFVNIEFRRNAGGPFGGGEVLEVYPVEIRMDQARDRWLPVGTIGTAPPNTEKVRFVVGVFNEEFSPGALYFDNVSAMLLDPEPTTGGPMGCSPADINPIGNPDGIIDVFDLIAFLQNFDPNDPNCTGN